jgi:hypothetical protein
MSSTVRQKAYKAHSGSFFLREKSGGKIKGFAVLCRDLLHLFISSAQGSVSSPVRKEGASPWGWNLASQGKELIFPIGLYLHVEPPN